MTYRKIKKHLKGARYTVYALVPCHIEQYQKLQHVLSQYRDSFSTMSNSSVTKHFNWKVKILKSFIAMSN